MSWEDTIKMPKHLKRIKRKIDQMPEYEVVEINARAAHGGKVDFTETEENEKHEDEPHTFYPPSTPKDKTYGNYMRKLPSIMRRAAQGRKRYMNQSGKPLVAKGEEMNNIRKMAERFDYNSLPPERRAQVDDWYATEGLNQLKAEARKRGVKKLQDRTVNPMLHLLKFRKINNDYLTSNELEFKGPYLIQGYDLDQPEERAAYIKAPKVAKKYAGSGKPLPPAKPEQEKLPESFYDKIFAQAKTIGHPMKFAERREAIEKLIKVITEHQKNKINELDQTDVEAVEKVIEILSKDYEKYDYTDDSGQMQQGRGSSTTGMKGRHLDELQGLLEYLKANVTEKKSWRKTLKADKSLAQYIKDILDEMGYDSSTVKV